MVDLSDEIDLVREDNITICYVKNFTEKFKNYIKSVLTVVCYGLSIDKPEQIKYYPFEETIKSFKERYDNKTEDTKKGMLGELLAHILINLYVDNLKVFSPYFNKEETSIRKSFDILYIDTQKNCIRYGEVKSGEKPIDKTVSQANNGLLYDAESDLKDKFTSSKRIALWDSAKFDANAYMQSVGNFNNVNLHELLQNDRNTHLSNDKNVILISVCFNDVNDKISLDEVKGYEARQSKRNHFLNTILFSIQKSTFQKIETFLYEEYENAVNNIE